MPITLPYTFDTGESFRKVVKFAAWFEMLMVGGIVYSIFVSQNYIAVLPLVFAGLIAAGFVYVLIQAGECAIGTITRDGVVIEPSAAGFGLKFSGPAGRFALTQFSGVRTRETSGPVTPSVNAGPSSRVYLVGKPGTPDLMIARVDGEGIETGREFAAALGLPFEDTRVIWKIGQGGERGS